MKQDKEILYRFFIGSNNKTKKPEVKKAIEVFNFLDVSGFSIIKNICGYWNKQQEKSFVVEILSNKYNSITDNKATAIKNLLEKRLKQELVLTTRQDISVLN